MQPSESLEVDGEFFEDDEFPVPGYIKSRQAKVDAIKEVFLRTIDSVGGNIDATYLRLQAGFLAETIFWELETTEMKAALMSAFEDAQAEPRKERFLS